MFILPLLLTFFQRYQARRVLEQVGPQYNAAQARHSGQGNRSLSHEAQYTCAAVPLGYPDVQDSGTQGE